LAGARDLADGAREDPLSLENQLEIELIEGRIAVETLRQCEKLFAGLDQVQHFRA